jgi:peptidoglycan/LPS O-acetylase OafA/YrhL
MNRVEGSDRVRALAALSVMLAHLVGPSMGAYMYVFTGAPAVMAFFVVSGFCIHYPYVARPLPVGAFLSSRWTRIMIPSLIAMAGAQALGIREYNFVDGYILWSIVCELAYYTIYPLLLLVRKRVGWLTLYVGSLGLAYVVAISFGSDKYGNITVYGPQLNWLVMLPSWLLGCILAEQLTNTRPTTSKSKLWLSRVAVAAIASLTYWATLNTEIGFYLTMNPFALLVFWWLRQEIAAGGEGWLGWVGRRSYSIYLVHIVAATLIQKFSFSYSFPPLAFAAFAFVLSLGFYEAVERPSHRLARRMFQRFNPVVATTG